MPRNFLSKVIGNKKFLSNWCPEVELASPRTDQFNGCLHFRRFCGCQGPLKSAKAVAKNEKLQRLLSTINIHARSTSRGVCSLITNDSRRILSQLSRTVAETTFGDSRIAENMQNEINFTATSIRSTECAIKILHLSCHR